MAGFQQLKVTREVDFTGAAQINVGSNKPQLLGGKTFFVNVRNGDDGYEGTSSAYPLAKLETAYDRCTTNKNDYIFVQNFWELTTAPLVIAKSDVHIIALGSGNFDQGNDIDGGSSVSIQIGADAMDFELAGFNLGNDDTTYALEVPSPSVAYRAHIHHCTFGSNFPATDGIHLWNLGRVTIDHCIFGNALSEYGIVGVGVVDCQILDNMFLDVADEHKGIYIRATQTVIARNMFFSPIALADDSGWGITLQDGSTDCFVANNLASDTGDAAGNEPYRDETSTSTATMKNGWAANMWGQDFINPDKSDS